MRKQYYLFITLLISVSAISLAVQGCMWRDDFRDRIQPQYFDQPIRPTLNKESLDYIGDDTNKTTHDEQVTPMPEIDGRAKIPALPQYPCTVED